MRVRIKICGVTDMAGLESAVIEGADAVGFVVADSPRKLTYEAAAELVEQTPVGVASVVVMHHPTPEQVREAHAATNADFIQTEVTRSIAEIGPRIRLLPVVHEEEATLASLASLKRSYPHAFRSVVLEAGGRGGRGRSPSLELAERLASRHRLVLAGGLTPENVTQSILEVRPYGVDVSSGVESEPGIKNPDRIAAFVLAVRQAEQRLRGESVLWT